MMIDNLRVWMGAKLILLGLRVAGFYSNVKWQTFMMIGERRDSTPTDYDLLREAVIDRARSEGLRNPDLLPDTLIRHRRESRAEQG